MQVMLFVFSLLMCLRSIGAMGILPGGECPAWWWPPDGCLIERTAPVEGVPVNVVVGGDWPDTCIPNGANVSVFDDMINVHVVCDPPPFACFTVITPWQERVDAGVLSRGLYVVTATESNCARFFQCPPAELCHVAVVDDDGDVDLEDFEIMAACSIPRIIVGRHGCEVFDVDADDDLDLLDFAAFQVAFTGRNE